MTDVIAWQPRRTCRASRSQENTGLSLICWTNIILEKLWLTGRKHSVTSGQLRWAVFLPIKLAFSLSSSFFFSGQGRNNEVADWSPLCKGRDSFVSVFNDQHLIQEILFESPNKDVTVLDPANQLLIHPKQVVLPSLPQRYRFLKLIIHQPSTRWGSSIWRWQVWSETLNADTRNAL